MNDYQDICTFLYKEARLLDDRQWDEWLKLYDENCPFWMPAWDDNDTLTEDPQAQISLIYYPNKNGLEDRIFRIKTERSSASMPEPRTLHTISNIEVLEQSGDQVKVRFNWVTHNFRYLHHHQFFGVSFYSLKKNGGSYLITHKKTILKNDYIPQVIDVYHL